MENRGEVLMEKISKLELEPNHIEEGMKKTMIELLGEVIPTNPTNPDLEMPISALSKLITLVLTGEKISDHVKDDELTCEQTNNHVDEDEITCEKIIQQTNDNWKYDIPTDWKYNIPTESVTWQILQAKTPKNWKYDIPTKSVKSGNSMYVAIAVSAMFRLVAMAVTGK